MPVCRKGKLASPFLEKIQELTAGLSEEEQVKKLSEFKLFNWESVVLTQDPSIGLFARTARNFYFGYQYVWPDSFVSTKNSLLPSDNQYYNKLLLSADLKRELLDYLTEVCKGKWRVDLIYCQWVPSISDYELYDWNMRSDVKHSVRLFVAFQEEKDFVNFLLRWSSYSQ